MNQESFARTLCAVSDVLTTLKGNPKWFVSFGALLYFIRDRLIGRPFETDLDISMIYGESDRAELVKGMMEYGFQVEKELVDNHYHKPLQITFKPIANSLSNVHVDIFFWVMNKQYAWHTFKGQEFTFKGLPKYLIEAPTIPYHWEEIAPPMNFPTMYGSLLDLWYPPIKCADGKYAPNSGWLFPNRSYGYSKAPFETTVFNCKELIG